LGCANEKGTAVMGGLLPIARAMGWGALLSRAWRGRCCDGDALVDGREEMGEGKKRQWVRGVSLYGRWGEGG
jgi:hypothetical protein